MPLVAYVSLRIWLPAEDERLQKEFGQEYCRYRDKTPALWPGHAPCGCKPHKE